jgi:hypothetical protein
MYRTNDDGCMLEAKAAVAPMNKRPLVIRAARVILTFPEDCSRLLKVKRSYLAAETSVHA